tara:strand:+ start:12683 stop:13447 length:765 start_codon:yes stop_codon:yes gene_type:complete
MKRRIWTFWQQGRADAPDLVKFCCDRWETLNPDWDLVVLDGAEADRVLSGFPQRAENMSVQAWSDVLRLHLLRDGDCIWIDPTVLPVLPLKDWAGFGEPDVRFTVFDRPKPDRLIASWFLAPRPDCPLMKEWNHHVHRYWAVERTVMRNAQGWAIIPDDPIREVSPDGPASTYPYFWVHYLFAWCVANDPASADIWSKARVFPAEQAHRLQFLLKREPQPDDDTMAEVLAAVPVQKLNWRADYPLDRLTAFLSD